MDDIQGFESLKKYSIADYKNHSDDEWFSIIKESWGYAKGQAFDVMGSLKEIVAKTGTFYLLENIHNVNDGSALLYPLKSDDIPQTIFIGSINERELGNDYIDDETLRNKWVKVRVELSPEKERVKHRNPMALSMVRGGLHLLQSVPEGITSSEIVIDGITHIEQWVIDFYREKNRKSIIEEDKKFKERLDQARETLKAGIEQESEQLKNEVDVIQSKKESLVNELAKLDDQKAEGSEDWHQIQEKIIETKAAKKELEIDYKNNKQFMEHKLSTLNTFIEQKAKILLELDLIGESEMNTLLGVNGNEEKIEAHNFSEVFSSDLSESIAYIQAFMLNKGIIYRRNVLEDFFALLTTHDLIILAGDSGSGKTNLVKSFAEAIGGKSIVVPVKPNWTSAEDLLGYYNPLEQKYLSTPFLDALFEAAKHPNTPYFICLDEMNLARVEYYFADFLSLMEERNQAPEFKLYSDTEASHLVSETRNFLSLIDEAKTKLDKPDPKDFLDLLRDEDINAKLHELCGFREGDSLLKYHGQLRRLMGNYINTPSSMRLPPNVRIIGAINMDETTHYLSPKILDRAHIIRFGNPLLTDWDKAESEVKDFDLDLSLPINFDLAILGSRKQYPDFDRSDDLVETLIHIVQEYLEPLGVEFGLRTVRQARHYSAALQRFDANSDLILNNIVLHKILPKLMFDGGKAVTDDTARKDVLKLMRDYLANRLVNLQSIDVNDSCIAELDRVIRNAEANDWVVNYWSR